MYVSESLVQETQNEKYGQSSLTEAALMSETDPKSTEVQSSRKTKDNLRAYFVCPMSFGMSCANKYDSREQLENHLEQFHHIPIQFQNSMVGLQNCMRIAEGMIEKTTNIRIKRKNSHFYEGMTTSWPNNHIWYFYFNM